MEAKKFNQRIRSICIRTYIISMESFDSSRGEKAYISSCK
ncbi:Protein of unknown function [Bacillus cytotoxicus]|nr:Protein of unknown function [Bacillus cytotoxicus]